MEYSGEFERRAPYAPISALRDFFLRIRDVTVPARVDRRFLQKLSVASNNEWALLSALKFLGVVDERGVPTHAYRLLQTTDRFTDTLRHLVETAYAPLFEVNGSSMGTDELRNYFRVTSSPSQAKNAARFFREVCELAGISTPETAPRPRPAFQQTGAGSAVEAPQAGQLRERGRETPTRVEGVSLAILDAKARLLEKLPPPREDWTAEQYMAICDRFLALVGTLDNG